MNKYLHTVASGWIFINIVLYLLGKTEKNHERFQVRWLVTPLDWSRIGPGYTPHALPPVQCLVIVRNDGQLVKGFQSADSGRVCSPAQFSVNRRPNVFETGDTLGISPQLAC